MIWMRPCRDVFGVGCPSVRHGAGKAKITDFQHPRFRHQEILGLDIAVHDIVRMAVLDRAKELPHETPNGLRIQAFWILFNLF